VIVANQPAASSCTIEQQCIGQIEVLTVAGVVDMLTAAQLE
jgi:anti-sigma B factor antagonist